MKYLFLLLLPAFALANSIPPTPFPVFLKSGFSSVMEFDVAPTRVVLGDGQSFQVERVENSLVIRTLAPYAVTNMFVYFQSYDPKLFVLTASEEAEPTYYKRIQVKPITAPATQPTPKAGSAKYRTGGRVLRREFDAKKDYLVVGFELSADSSESLKPNWNLVRLTHGKSVVAPIKLWAERQDVQRDSRIFARLIFAKPNVPRNLAGVNLVVPLKGKTSPITLTVAGDK